MIDANTPDHRAMGPLSAFGENLDVLHVITGLMTGGAEKAMCRIVVELQTLGVSSSVVTFRDGPVRNELLRGGIEATVIDPTIVGDALASMKRLRKHVKSRRPTIIQGWMYHANLAALMYGKALGVPVSWGVRQGLSDDHHDKLTTRLIIHGSARLSRFADAIVFNSASSSRQHVEAGFRASRGIVIQNGFDTDRFLPNESAREKVRADLNLPGSAVVVGHVARYHSVKNHSMFVKAMMSVLEQCPSVYAVMAGRDVELLNSPLGEEVRATGHAARFRLLGERRDIESLLCGMDLICLTSWSESFPNIVGEAMACGVPCISTDVGDVRWIIGRTGAVVDVNDSVGMASAILDYASTNEADRQERGANCRERIVHEFSIRGAAERYRGLYMSLREASCGPSRRQVDRVTR